MTRGRLFDQGVLTEKEAEILDQGGFSLKECSNDEVTMSGQFIELIASSLTTTEAANLLGTSPRKVRQRVRQRTLYGFKVRRTWHIPSFQFDSDGEVLNLARVFSSIRSDAHPLVLHQWLTLPNPDLGS